VNEAVAMGVAVCVDPIAAAAANILALKTGLLHPPNTDSMVVARRCEHMWICWIPAYAVDCARMTRQSLNEITCVSMPYIDLKMGKLFHMIHRY
jgi:hypothetical protein